MNEDELRRMQLPGYWAWTHAERPHWSWTVLWFAWGAIIATACIWRDHAHVIGGCFAAWGMFMGLGGWQSLMIVFEIVHDWAERRFTDPELELAAIREICAAIDAQGGEFENAGLHIPDTPLQAQWKQEQFFAVMCATPWMMGPVHGVGFGGLIGMLAGLVPDTCLSLSTWASLGALCGGVTVAFTTALGSACIFGCGNAPVVRQRLWLIISPVMVAPALLEGVLLWGPWFLRRFRDRI